MIFFSPSVKLFFSFHFNSLSGADKGADAASFAEFKVDFNTAAHRVARDTEFRAGEAAKIAALAEMIAKASPCLFYSISIIYSGFGYGFGFGEDAPGFFKFAFFGDNLFCLCHVMYFNLV